MEKENATCPDCGHEDEYKGYTFTCKKCGVKYLTPSGKKYMESGEWEGVFKKTVCDLANKFKNKL